MAMYTILIHFMPVSYTHLDVYKRQEEAITQSGYIYKGTIPDKEETEMKETVKIEGMMCGHCEATVKKALEALDGVEQAEVSHEKGEAVLTLSHAVADKDIQAAVEGKDYKFLGKMCIRDSWGTGLPTFTRQ